AWLCHEAGPRAETVGLCHAMSERPRSRAATPPLITHHSSLTTPLLPFTTHLPPSVINRRSFWEGQSRGFVGHAVSAALHALLVNQIRRVYGAGKLTPRSDLEQPGFPKIVRGCTISSDGRPTSIRTEKTLSIQAWKN